MIKADVKATGSIKRSAAMKTDKNGNAYMSVVLCFSVPDIKEGTKDVEVAINYAGGSKSDIKQYQKGHRITASGTLDVHKMGEDLAFYLNASELGKAGEDDADGIKGTVHFRGYLKKENVYEEKEARNGNRFFTFSAYSPEKVGDNFVSTWVSFIWFPEKDADMEGIKRSWLASKAHVAIDGDFRLEAYGKRLMISSQVQSAGLCQADGQK